MPDPPYAELYAATLIDYAIIAPLPPHFRHCFRRCYADTLTIIILLPRHFDAASATPLLTPLRHCQRHYCLMLSRCAIDICAITRHAMMDYAAAII